MPPLTRAAGTLLVAVLALGASGCTGPDGVATPSGPTGPSGSVAPSATESGRPCRAGAEVSLGRPGEPKDPATFRSDGGDLLVGAEGFAHGGPLDPAVGKTLVHLGDRAVPPVFDLQRAVVENATHEVMVVEGKDSRISLPAGAYWLSSSNTVTILLTPCAPTELTEVIPAP